MMLQKYKSVIDLLKISGLVYILHQFLFFILKINQGTFQYSLTVLYLFFVGYSVLLFMILLRVKVESFDNVGMSFLLGTSIKILPCYLLAKPIINCASCSNTTERINFFGLFVVFLVIETVLTIRLLNKKD
ncbi:hypothetical protein FFWV33_04305 [Flavobacterium faecale]|uniref:Uncharacterized protein n=1 Tax=Flavobacterium faecale TaxID=1355330 RepID=A0A2S1LAU9_9FLAO|nr:hypothetical protein FFWV33_04305 [Flavobacterium faecale]